MPVVRSRFVPPKWLRNGHLQTVLGVLLRRAIEIRFKRERLELADGDFVDLDWVCERQNRVAILSHGLEGCSRNGCIRGLASALRAAAWDVLAWNFRGCGGEPNRLVRFYHSGETEDLAAVVRHAASRYDRIALVGFSLGGNITLKYLGEAPPHPAIVAAAAVSVPIALAACARVLDQRRGNRLYLRRFLASLIAKVEAKALRFPEELDAAGVRAIRSIAAYDERFTAPLHGFRDAEDYWDRSSSRQFLAGIRVPTLLLNARDDPFLTPESFPEAEAKANGCLYLEAPDAGGHVGFLDLKRGLQPWFEARIVEFLDGKDRGDLFFGQSGAGQ